MIGDERTTFADATALSTAATGRQLVGNVVHLSNARDIGGPGNVWLVLVVSTAFTSAGAATVSFELVSDAQAAIAVDGSATVHFATAAFPKASLTVGAVVAKIPLPPESSLTAYEQYLGIIANVGTAALTAGAVSAFLTMQPPLQKSYPDGIN